MKGKFIVFEGIDGAGLSTQALLLESRLRKSGYKVVLTKEPTNGLIGGLIKACLKNEWKTSLTALQILFAADRAHHLSYEIIPSLKKGKIVICDRYILSTIAYGMIELEREWLEALNSKFLKPDITFLIDIPVEVSLKRIKAARFGAEIFEKRRQLEKVRKNYLKLISSAKNSFVIDGTKPIEEVHEDIIKIVKGVLRLKVRD
ncbi:MAG TPA: dTMP kinase [Candidatus Aenigmarchaeota archaeon]|nr:dTMP kinase [Candidatus Aenigmarchaeota archaeon]